MSKLLIINHISMKNSLTIFAFIFSFFLFTSNAEASFPVKKSSKNSSELITTETIDNGEMPAALNSGKSQIAATLLCFFVGIIGVHRFYLGYAWQGVVQILTLGGFGIWTLIDFIRIITGDLQPKNGSYSQTF